MKGIYGIFRKADDKCVYVGQSSDIDCRIKHHLNGHTRNSFNKDEYYGEMIEEHMINDKQFRLEREAYWIEQLNPELNVIRDETNKGEYISGENHPMYGKPAWNRGISPSEETKKKMSEHADHKGEKNPMYGKNCEDYMTPEAIKEKRQKQSEAIKGMKFINNGVINKRVKDDELDKYIQDGWCVGRLSWKRNS